MAGKKKILIVEDEMFLAEMIELRLKNLGYDVFCAENGEAALHFLRTQKVDAILMDVMMPVMDGWEATRRLKADARFKKVPVIFLTARARPEDRATGMAAGGDDYLTKPFDIKDLVAMVKKWTGK